MELGQVAGRVLNALLDEDSAFEDMHLWCAPYECGRLISRRTDREIDKALKEAGMTRKEFVEAVVERTTPKYAYFSGLASIRH